MRREWKGGVAFLDIIVLGESENGFIWHFGVSTFLMRQ